MNKIKVKEKRLKVYKLIYNKSYIYPKLWMYVLHNLHVQPMGFQFLISIVNSGNVFKFRIESGRS